MILAATLALAAGLGGTASLDIVSDSSCPAASMVRAALEGLRGAAPSRSAAISVRSRAGGLRLEFRWAGDGPADAREVPTSADCTERANAAAIVAAAWLGVLPEAPQFAPPSPSPSPSSPPAVVVVPAPDGPPAPPAQSWLGIGLGAGVGGGVAVSGRVELARVRPRPLGLGWMVAAQGTLPRSRSVAAGSSSWVRPALGVAGTAAWQSARLGLAADLGPLAALTFAWGSGYPSNTGDRAPALGVAAGVRLQMVGGSARPWIELRGVRWLTSQRLRVDSSNTDPVTAELPAYEAFVTLGWSLPVP